MSDRPTGTVKWKPDLGFVQRYAILRNPDHQPIKAFVGYDEAIVDGRPPTGRYWLVWQRKDGSCRARTERSVGGRGGSINCSSEVAAELWATTGVTSD